MLCAHAYTHVCMVYVMVIRSGFELWTQYLSREPASVYALMCACMYADEDVGTLKSV